MQQITDRAVDQPALPDPLLEHAHVHAAVLRRHGLAGARPREYSGEPQRHVHFFTRCLRTPLLQVCNLMWSKNVNGIVSTHG